VSQVFSRASCTDFSVISNYSQEKKESPVKENKKEIKENVTLGGRVNVGDSVIMTRVEGVRGVRGVGCVWVVGM
jgi:hypothetical protein